MFSLQNFWAAEQIASGPALLQYVILGDADKQVDVNGKTLSAYLISAAASFRESGSRLLKGPRRDERVIPSNYG